MNQNASPRQETQALPSGRDPSRNGFDRAHGPVRMSSLLALAMGGA